MSKQLIDLQEENNICLSDDHRNTNTGMKKIVFIMQYLKTEFNKILETWRKYNLKH